MKEECKPTWIDTMWEGMPPTECYILLQGYVYITLPEKYKFEDHEIYMEVKFHDLQWITGSFEEIAKEKFSLEKATFLGWKSACCTSKEDSEKHNEFLRDQSLWYKNISKFINLKKTYYKFENIEKWIYIDEIPRIKDTYDKNE